MKLSLSCEEYFLITYPKSSKCCWFYASSHSNRILETKHAEFLVIIKISGNVLVPIRTLLGDSSLNILPHENDYSNTEANEVPQHDPIRILICNEAIIDDLNFMKNYDVWELVELLKGCNPLMQEEGWYWLPRNVLTYFSKVLPQDPNSLCNPF
ncbi:hypothetical protein LXL04_003968 [Taraxacum kok-saghyz]